MKLRIKGNSLRLRLLQGEVKRLVSEGEVSESICFGTRPVDVLQYTVRISESAKDIKVTFVNGVIAVDLSKEITERWAESDEITIESKQDPDVCGIIPQVIVEKDFVCLDRKDDPDRADAFPHPKANC